MHNFEELNENFYIVCWDMGIDADETLMMEEHDDYLLHK